MGTYPLALHRKKGSFIKHTPLSTMKSILVVGTLVALAALEAHANETSVQVPEGLIICQAPEGDERFEAHLERLGNYCVNGGTCKTSVGPQTLEMCDCPENLAGAHCEFEAGVVPPCNRQCYNEGTCQIGLKYWDEPIVSTMEDLNFCICKEGFSGPYCEIEDDVCQTHHCKNGGSCVTLSDDSGNNLTGHCDCTTAGTEDQKFTGEFCEVPATDTCDADHNGHLFCTNGGVCRKDTFLGCDCPDGFIGPLCEFEDLGLVPQPCDTSCENDGICRHGAKDTSFLSQFGIHHRNLQQKYNSDFEHCVCPVGYAGVHCEYILDVCPGEQHACMNGGDCKAHSDSSGFEWTCDCRRAHTDDHLYAGSSCEFKSTSYCTIDGKQPRIGTGHEAFCVNEGKCKGFVMGDREHPGCECPDGFFGDHCEFFDPNEILEREEGKTHESSENKFLPWLLLGAGFVGTMLIVSLFIMRRRKIRRNRERDSVVSYINNHYSDSPQAIAPTLSQVNDAWIYSESDASESFASTRGGDAPSGDESVASTITDKQPTGAVSLMKSENMITDIEVYDPTSQIMI